MTELRAEHTEDCNCTECRLVRAEQALRTSESLRAQAAYKSPAESPFAVSRVQAATILGAVMHDHDVSKNRLADLLGVDEKQVRKYLDGRAHLPSAALLVMPVGMADDYTRRMRESRGAPRQSAVDQFRAALSALEQAPASPQVVAAIAEGHMRLGALSARQR